MNELKFDRVYAEYKTIVERLVKPSVYPHLECVDEIVNDVFLKVSQNLKNFDANKSQLKTWIITITNNTLIDHFRSIKLEKDSKVNYLDYKHYTDAMYSLNSDDTADGEMIYSESMVLLMKAIKKMDATMQNIADMRFFKDLKYCEIATELDIPINTVKTHIKRIKEFLIKNTQLA